MINKSYSIKLTLFIFIEFWILLINIVINYFDYSNFNSLDKSKYLIQLLIIVIIITQIITIDRLSNIKFIGNKIYEGITYYKIFYYFLIKTQHHPNCECYKAHEFNFKGKRVCSGCYGTILGILIGILLISDFLIFNFLHSYISNWVVYFVLGSFLIQITFIKYIFEVNLFNNSFFRMILNISFPIGLNLIILSSLVSNTYVLKLITILMLILPILITRLLFTKLDHSENDNCPQNLH